MRRAHLEEKDAFAARMPGRISEFLLDVWIDTNEICCIEIPLTSTEPVNWFKKEALFSKPSFSRKNIPLPFSRTAHGWRTVFTDLCLLNTSQPNSPAGWYGLRDPVF